MSAHTNQDRIYVPREYRARIRVARDEAASSRFLSQDATFMGLGAALLDISIGGCCLKLLRFDVPVDLAPGSLLSSIKLLHPAFDGSPISARIAWRNDEPPHVLLGIQFLDMRPTTLESVRSFVESNLNRSKNSMEPRS